MKQFHTLVGARKPVEHIALAVRDTLPDIAPALDDVEIIRSLQRTSHADGSVMLINEWRVNPKLPASLKNVITPDMLGWEDHAEWNADMMQCHWQIKPYFMPEAITCSGSTRFEPAMGGRGTRAVFEGVFEIDNDALTRVPAAWRSTASSGIELLIGSMIPKNFRKMIDTIAATEH